MAKATLGLPQWAGACAELSDGWRGRNSSKQATAPKAACYSPRRWVLCSRGGRDVRLKLPNSHRSRVSRLSPP